MLVQEPVQAAIWHCLNHYDYSDAIFLAERLRAEVESEETIWLLATCYYRSGKPSQAYHILKNSTSPQCKFLFAKCCIDLQKLCEAEKVLSGGEGRGRGLEELVNEFGDMAGFALLLLARVNQATDRHHKALEATTKALKVNPFLWSAFEYLCRAGEKPNPTKVFSVDGLDSLCNVTGTNPVINYVNSQASPQAPTKTPENPPLNMLPTNNALCTPVQTVSMGGTCVSGVREFTPEVSPLPLPLSCRPKRAIRYSRNIFSGSFSPLTPSFGIIPLDMNSSGLDSFPSPLNTLTEVNDQKIMNKRVRYGAHDHRARLNESFLEGSRGLRELLEVGGRGMMAASPRTPSPESMLPPPTVPPAPTVPRRSSRLFSNAYNVKENSKSPNQGKFVTPKSPSRKTKARGLGKMSQRNNSGTTAEAMNEKNRTGGMEPLDSTRPSNLCLQALNLQRHSLDGLMVLLREVGWAYLHLSQFECKKAIRCLNQLPPHHKNTGWVLSLIARAYFEDNDYKHAVKYFAEVRSREPERTQTMEIYSTALWHLSKEMQLSALAHDLLQADRNCPETWCAVGNCMSLNKEHDQAIKSFKRAVQVDPSFVYAYTLLGHEYVSTDELDNGMSCYRNAVRLDTRHYNAWYGIGTIFSKQEKFQVAELHYKRALAINPNSCVLMCHIGVMQLALQRKEEALDTLDRALKLDPTNALCKFHRASVLTSCNEHQEALAELEQLKQQVPKESMVYYLTGKVHKKLGNTHLALMHFSWATDLDPKGATPQIKEAIDPSLPHSHADDLGEDSATDEMLQRTPNQDAETASSDFSF